MLPGSRAAWVPAALGFVIYVLGSCSASGEKATPVPAKPGLHQPESGGMLLDENEACQRVTAAEETRRRSLMCDALVHPACPYYVRPAGTGCWHYPEGSVAACEDSIGDYSSCFDFDQRRCVITAVPAPALDCPSLGAGGQGSGGAPSGGGSGGEGG